MADNRYKRKNKKNNVKILLVLAIVIVLAAAVVIVVLATSSDRYEVKTGEGGSTKPNEEDWGNRLVYKGKNYRRNENLSTILFLGVDQNSEDLDEGPNETEVGTIGTGGRADSIILFILDDSTQTTRMLTISRDTMTDIDIYDMKGKFVSTGQNQITMQYAYGDSPSKSLFLTKRTVGKLLYGIRIDGALSLTMDGINKVVDLLGGIKLTMPQDYSYIDPQYTEGATVTLDGNAMERFIRYRDTSIAGSNEERVKRQTWLIGAVFQELKSSGAMKFLEEIIDSDPEYIESDVDGELLKKLSKYDIEEEKYKIPGEVIEGDKHDEFYVDEEGLQEMIVNLLYVPVE